MIRFTAASQVKSAKATTRKKSRIVPARSSLGWSLVTVGVLVTAKVLCEHQPWVESLERQAYTLMQKRLFAGGVRDRPPVLVIDLGGIRPLELSRGDQSVSVIPRTALKNLIDALVASDARSIGVDIDFSPKDGAYLDPQDPEFFDWCLKRSEEADVPIWLGVLRTYSQPYRWLGDDRYMRLAAATALPAVAQGRAVYWIMNKKGRVPLPSLGAAIAGADVSLNVSDRSFWSWAVDSTSVIERSENLRSAELPIDFSPLRRMQEDALPTLDPHVLRQFKDKIEGRMILLGDAHPVERDLFTIPGIPGQVPGVFLHACAASTIAEQPLYELTAIGRISIDLLLALVIIGLARGVLWLLEKGRLAFVHAEEKLSFLFTFLTIFVVAMVSLFFVRLTRLLWTDFVLVCLVMVVQLIVDALRSRLHSPPKVTIT